MTGAQTATVSGDWTADTGWVDNVVRQQQFMAANPDVKISHHRNEDAAGAFVIWSGVIILDGEEHTVTGHRLGDLLAKLEGLAGQRAERLALLKDAWGDLYENIRVDEHGRWRGRRRTGDGRELDAGTADELSTVFEADQDREAGR